jgi:hypothetical protein
MKLIRKLVSLSILISMGGARSETLYKKEGASAVQGDDRNLVDLFISKSIPMEFDGKSKTLYAKGNQYLEATVQNSASALVLPFDQTKSIKSVSFDWCTTRNMREVSSQVEKTKAGDDAALRLGLLLAGDPPMIPMFLPNWLKRLEKIVKFPTNRVLYLTAGIASDPGTTWVSPYTKYMTMIVVESSKKSLSWCKNGFHADFHAKQDLLVTGLWYMADGDDLKQSFTTWISNIVLK